MLIHKLIVITRRIFLMLLILGTLFTSYYVYDGFMRRQATAQSTPSERPRSEPGRHVSTKAKIEHLGPDGTLEWSLEAERMEFLFDDSGELNGIECFDSVVYIRGNMTVRARSCRYDMENKRFTFDGHDRP